MKSFIQFENVSILIISLTLLFSCHLGNKEYKPSLEFHERVKYEVDSISSSIELQAYLRHIYELDQKYRTEEGVVLDKFGHDSYEHKQNREKLNRTDAENLVRIEQVFDKFGYPDRNEVGLIAASAPWSVIHHASGYSVREKHFKTIYRAYQEGNIDAGEMDFYLGRMFQIKFGSYFNMPSPYRNKDKIDTLIFMLELKRE